VGLPELCIRRPVMTTLLMLATLLLGIFGYRTLPVAALPAVDFPTIQVTATLPGASPETMAASVATVLERQFSTISGITSITSISGQGSTSITLQFDLDRDIDGAALDVQSALSVAARRLPNEITDPPSFRKVNPADQPVILLALSSATLPLWQVHDYADTYIAPRLSILPGVAQVSIWGSQKFAVRVRFDPDALAAKGIAVNEVREALARANSNSPLGTLDGPTQTFVLDASGPLARAELYKPLIVAWHKGAPVRLEDVATVEDSVENDKVASWLNGRRSIILAVQRQPDANTVQVTDAVKALLPTFRAQLPPAVGIDVLIDRSQSIRASVADVQFTLVLTMALVVMVIFLFLRNLRATMIPALALPISVVGTFAGMYLCGFSINNLTLLALTLSVGFVVDDAIVMLENIVRHIENGMRPFEAALKGSREIGFTIVSITLSLVAVFIPVLFMGGVVGRLFNEFAVTISLAILISGFVSLTLTPMLSARLLRPHGHDPRQGSLYRAAEAAFERLLVLYRRSLDWVLGRRPLMLAITLATVAGTGWAFVTIPKGFFPDEDTGLLYIATEAPQDISFAAMAERQKLVAEVVQANPHVVLANSIIGIAGSSSAMNNGRIFVQLAPRDQRPSAKEIQQDLRRQLAHVPGINAYIQLIQNIQIGGRPAKGQYQYSLQGVDQQELFEWAPRLEAKLRGLPAFQDVSTDLQLGSREAAVEIDRDAAARLGVSVEDVRSTLYSAFGSRQVSTIYTPSNDYQVILEAAREFKQDPAALSRLYVRGAGDALIPLDAIASIRLQSAPLSISHEGQLPSVTIAFNLPPGVALGEAVAQAERAERELGVPATILTGFAGTAQVYQASLSNQLVLIFAALITIYILLGVLYESFINPLTILSGLPSAGLGALLTLMLFRHDLNVIGIIGIVMLIGIVKKNAIMMIDFAIARRRRGDVPALTAIREACLLRFRPITMTTVAAIAGTLPIAIGMGAGSELRQPLGLCVVGGLLVSQLLTLYITPVIYLYLDGLSERLSGRGSARAVSTEMPPGRIPAAGE
jgi:HAE1 family hydrophobic/amphiphilic exporter-1